MKEIKLSLTLGDLCELEDCVDYYKIYSNYYNDDTKRIHEYIKNKLDNPCEINDCGKVGLDCFSDDDMFFGGCVYQFDLELKKNTTAKSLHESRGLSEEKIKQRLDRIVEYIECDGIKFSCDNDHPTPICFVTLNNGKKFSMHRHCCKKIGVVNYDE